MCRLGASLDNTSCREKFTLRTPINLLIVDDQIVVRAGFSSVLRAHAGLNLAGAVSSGEEALPLIERHHVQVLLLDLRMPGMSGVDTLLALRKLARRPKTIVLSSFEPDEEILRAVESGAQGYLRKDTSITEIVDAIYAVHSGASYLPPWIEARISQRKLRSNLSPRELEILEMVAKGLTNKEIGRVIQVSPFTVRNHVRHIMAKLEVGDRTEAATVAIREGILTTHDSCAGGDSDKSQAPATIHFSLEASRSRSLVRNALANWDLLPKPLGAN
jgi:DNA-binding NarL/FixJ family response regulator